MYVSVYICTEIFDKQFTFCRQWRHLLLLKCNNFTIKNLQGRTVISDTQTLNYLLLKNPNAIFNLVIHSFKFRMKNKNIYQWIFIKFLHQSVYIIHHIFLSGLFIKMMNANAIYESYHYEENNDKDFHVYT